MSDKTGGIYNIGYITIKTIGGYENIHRVNPLCLIIDEVNWHIECNFVEEKKGTYLVFDFADENKELLKKIPKSLEWD